MISVTLTYYPGRLRRWLNFFNRPVFVGNQPEYFTRQLPEKWNELNRDQLLAISRATFLQRDRSLQKIFIAHKFLKLPFGVFRKIALTDIDAVYNSMSERMGENNLYKTLITDFTLRAVKYYGPSDMGNNLTLDEFAKADKHYSAFTSRKNVDDLDKLIACLYREKRSDLKQTDREYDGDLRVPFNEYHVANRALRVHRLSDDIKYAILLQYSGFRKFLQDRYPLTFSGGESSKYGISGMVVELAGPKFGTTDETFKSNIHPILIYTEQALQKADK